MVNFTNQLPSSHARVHLESSSNQSQQVIARLDLSVDIASATLYSYLKSPLIGFISRTPTISNRYRLILPEQPSKKSQKSKKTEHELEQKLLMDNFIKFLVVDEKTGALYFNISEQQSGLFLFSKWSKLRKFFLFERNQTSKLIKLDVQSEIDEKFTVFVELLFVTKSKTRRINQQDLEHRNQFVINSNNLLSMLRHGDEFVLSLSVDENSPTWTDPIVGLSEYLRTSVMRNRKATLHYEMIKDSIQFYLVSDKRYFT